MKRHILFTIVSLFCNVPLFAQLTSIELDIKNVKNAEVKVRVPVNQSAFDGNQKQVNLTSSGYLKIELNENETGPLTIEVLGKKALFYTQKGDKIKLSIDTANKTMPFKFNGNNAAGQQFLTERFLPKGRYFSVPMYEGYYAYILDSNAVDMEKKIKEKHLADLQTSQKLYTEKKIDSVFYSYLKTSSDYLYAGITAEAIRNHLRKFRELKDRNLHSGKLPSDFEELWKRTYQQYPPQSLLATQTIWINDYYFTYLNSYKCFLMENKGEIPPISHENEDLIRISATIKTEFPSKTAEFVHAQSLYSLGIEKRFQSAIIQWFADFKQQFPNSRYSSYIQPYVNDAVAFSDKAKANYTPQETIIENYNQINTLKELTDKLKGQTIFIDTWATWCPPCKAQFQYNKELKTFLKKNNVAMIYISIDEDKYDQRWKEMIKYYELEGFHVRANKELMANLDQLIWDGKRYIVPTYIIIDKQGNIVEKNALYPSHKAELYAQIEKYL
ncbi:redoxin family protein [Solitalea sp. MAHUQ-68]|uniref:Redoxin family protein n=1 Tax=Solitalea agri TaxID=2953739 RepID=A0A9X2JE07_9SPHI|nr:redoxin family protein [Solitalea agri]MCO4294683.1 redoxin family protein [Solitalea agri]